MGSSLFLYRLVMGAVRAGAPAFAGRDTKLARGLEGRRDAHGTLARWGRTARAPSRPCVWLHAPSVGEAFQARAVANALRELRPDVQLAFTHFSPSAEAVAGAMGADVHGYLPWDLRRPIREALDSLRPDLVLFTKTEVWPVLAAEAHARGAGVGLVAATVPAEAGRLTWPARALLGATWRELDAVCAIASPDADRLRSLGVREDVLHVTGDPAVDSAARRADGTSSDARHLAPFLADPRPTVLAGSTWASDEAVLVPALLDLRDRVPDLRVVIAPHEPDTTGVRALCERFEAAGCAATTLTLAETKGSVEGVDAVVVDRVGVLSDLYRCAHVAYVGGGFHDAGLHSVLEPAAARVPVVFGPRHQNAKAAADLLTIGGARRVDGTETLSERLGEWLLDESARDYAAQRAFGYIDAHRGAAARTAAIVADLLNAQA